MGLQIYLDSFGNKDLKQKNTENVSEKLNQNTGKFSCKHFSFNTQINIINKILKFCMVLNKTFESN